MGIKYAINERFFDRWSREMAYVLGFWFADGSVENAQHIRGRYLRVTSTDKDRIAIIRRLLQSRHTIVTMSPRSRRDKKRYLLRIGSHRMYQSLQKLGLYPRKSLTVCYPLVPSRFQSDFIRGYFDGDGCIFLERTRGTTGKRIVRRLTAIFTSGSKAFLHGLATKLSLTASVAKIPIRDSHRSFQLRYNTTDSVRLFSFFYKNTPKGLYVSRKFDIFAQYFQLRPSRVDTNIAEILYRCRRGHVVK